MKPTLRKPDSNGEEKRSTAPRLLFVVSEDWYFLSHRLPMARAAQAMGFEVGVATHVAEDGAAIRALGFTLFDIGDVRSQRGLRGRLALLRRLIAVTRGFAPSLVQNVAVEMVAFGTLSALLCRVPAVVNTISGMGRAAETPRSLALVSTLFRLFSRRRGVAFVVQNQDDYALIRAMALPARPVEIVEGSGVDIEHFAATPLPEAGPAPLVVCVARMLISKGIPELVEAARLLKRQGHIFRLILVGSPDPGNPGAVLAEDLRQWEAQELVEWWGERDDIAEIWQQATIAVLPSHREGLPKSLLEAASCGRPIVTTDVPGCRSAVADGENGLLVPVRNAGALAEALGRLLSDRDLCRQMGEAGRHRVEQRFSDAQVGRRMGAVYAAALCDGGAALPQIVALGSDEFDSGSVKL